MGESAPRERITIRLYVLDDRRHAYRAADLAPGRWWQVHPVCQDLDAVPGDELFEQLYALAHPTDLLDPRPHGSLGDPPLCCDRCARRLRVLEHDIVVGTGIVALGGTLVLPAPRAVDQSDHAGSTRQPPGLILAGA
ncbi:hypothetical protein [Amycolatopsis sp. NPDC051903]|uniref:hypothetical protein n=1 Tax=Amycolatopsis sp. NPDC051903 TaxID=3363936 RepID=UPI00379F8987